MKIGIITWHNMKNFGSMLQVYALQIVLKDMGHEVNIIDYRKYVKMKSITRFVNSSKILKRIKCSFSKKEWKRFVSFQLKYLNLTKPILDNKDLKLIGKIYDCYICGSDQIWSPNVFDSTYFLDFVAEGKMRIAYAPSVVIDNYTEEQSKIIARELQKFKAISTREKKGKKIIEKIGKFDCQVNLDPTMLLSKEKWDKLTIKIKEGKKYLLCYMLTYNEKSYNQIKKIAEERKLDIINIGVFKKDFANINLDIGPKEFLTYIKNAELVCTDSYHGTLFSINFEKEFYTFERFKENEILCQNDRIYEILEKLDLKERIVRKEIYKTKKIDYKKVKDILNKYKEKSIRFINDNLK